MENTKNVIFNENKDDRKQWQNAMAHHEFGNSLFGTYKTESGMYTE
jgi:hypothetical protein